MQDRPDGAVRILIVDDRLSDPRAWQTEADAIDARIAVRCADSAAALQNAVLEGNWACVLCRQSPARMSLNAILSMVQVLEPQPAVVLYPDAATALDRRRWLHAALRATGAPAPSLKPHGRDAQPRPVRSRPRVDVGPVDVRQHPDIQHQRRRGAARVA